MLIAFAGGVLVAIQTAMNAHLRSFVTTPLIAALISFAVGTLTLCLLVLVNRNGSGSGPSVTMGLAQGIPWWAWLGGLCGAGYVVSTMASVPQIGVGLCLSCVVLGQQLGAVTIDHQGWMAVAREPIGVQRLCGVLLILGGVWLQSRR
ncbi:DMT family transporter [Paraburkholderia oxyphila]|uniref:DMT family transporter n=1 Tax=Paraburkholderia oxyphila TaxID=614212 RepID=UPI000693B549|nr:DMT family transporter [Paraburkholderia oxyphila]